MTKFQRAAESASYLGFCLITVLAVIGGYLTLFAGFVVGICAFVLWLLLRSALAIAVGVLLTLAWQHWM